MNQVVEEFLTKIRDSGKFITLASTIDDFLYKEDSSDYIIIRPVNSDEFQIEVTKQKTEEGIDYIFNPVVITDDENEFKLNLNVKTKKQLDMLVNITADSLKKYSHFKRYGSTLKNLL